MYSGLDEAFLREIASHSHTSVDHVRRTYQLIIRDLQDNARIKDFIPLLAMNSLRQHFRDLTQHPSLSCSAVNLREEKNVKNRELFCKYALVKHSI